MTINRRNILKNLKHSIIFLSLLFSMPILAQDLTPLTAKPVFAKDLDELLHDAPESYWSGTRSERVYWLSEKIRDMDIPYGSVCGDGRGSLLNEGPFSSFSAMDCVTFEETVFAAADLDQYMTSAERLRNYNHNLMRIRYRNPKKPSLATRENFTSTDWSVRQVKNGILSELTTKVPRHCVERRTIRKEDWLKDKTIEEVYCYDLKTEEEKTKRLKKVQRKFRKHFKDVSNQEMAYIHIDDLIRNQEVTHTVKSSNESGEKVTMEMKIGIIHRLFELADSNILVFNMVTSDFRDGSTQYTLVMHTGFFVRLDDGSVVVRHANWGKTVLDTPLIDYLQPKQEGWRGYPIAGLNFYKIEN